MKVRFKRKGDGTSTVEITRNFKTLLSMWNGRDKGMYIKIDRKRAGDERNEESRYYYLRTSLIFENIYINLF